MCRPDDAPPYDPPALAPMRVLALAQAISGEDQPSWPIVEHAELFLLRLAIRRWQLVNMDEDGSPNE